MYSSSKSQGEIFGIALMFVVLILGIIIYGQIKALDVNRDVDLQKESEYNILAQGTLNSLKKMSTGCYIERGDDSFEVLLTYCLDNSFRPDDNPELDCYVGDKGPLIQTCSEAIYFLNTSLQHLFSTDSEKVIIAPIPFSLDIYAPAMPDHKLVGNKTLSNLENFGSNSTKYRRDGYKRVSSGLEILPTENRAIELSLSLYYK